MKHVSRRLIALAAVWFTLQTVAYPAFAAARPDDDDYLRAVSLLNQGIYFEAIGLLEAHLKRNPDDGTAHLRIAQALYHVKHDMAAAEHAAAALRANPDNDMARRILTRLRVKIGRELNYDDPEAMLQSARLCARTDSLDRSSAFYGRYLDLKDDPAVRLEYARTLGWSGRYEESIKQYLLYLSDSPTDFEACVELGKICNSAGAFSEAANILGDCLQEDPENRDLEMDLARAYFWGGDWNGGKALFERIASRPLPPEEDDLIFAASLFEKMGWTEKEGQAVKAILEINPNNHEAREHADMLAKTKAVEIYRLRREVAANPESSQARISLIELLIDQKRFDLAKPEIEQLTCTEEEREAIEERLVLAKKGFLTVARRGIDTMLRTGDAERSRQVQMCYSWLDSHPGDTRTRLLLADLLTADRLYEDAASQYAIILEQSPNHPSVVERLDRARELARAAEREDESDQGTTEKGMATTKAERQ